MAGRLVLLNALPLNAFTGTRFTITVERVDIETLRTAVREAETVECYIRHNATVSMLSTVLGKQLQPSSSLYRYNDGDILYVITLKTPQRGQELTNITQDDIEIFKVAVH
jgi:hypothetical protein